MRAPINPFEGIKLSSLPDRNRLSLLGNEVAKTSAAGWMNSVNVGAELTVRPAWRSELGKTAVVIEIDRESRCQSGVMFVVRSTDQSRPGTLKLDAAWFEGVANG